MIQMSRVLPLFRHNPHHAVAVACCEGLVPCRLFADDEAHPTAAVVVMERFGIGFAAGDAAHAPALLARLHDWHPWYAVNDPPLEWQPALAAWSKESYAAIRYGFTNDPRSFDPAALHGLARVPAGFSIRPYDHGLLEQALAAEWSEDQMGVFLTPEDFLAHGMGLAVVDEAGRLAAGCISFCCHGDGYEIQVDTRPDLRGRGLGACVSAAFVLRALERGKNPRWDAANCASLRLAQKLGYVFTAAFPAWMLIPAGTTPEEAARKAIGE